MCVSSLLHGRVSPERARPTCCPGTLSSASASAPRPSPRPVGAGRLGVAERRVRRRRVEDRLIRLAGPDGLRPRVVHLEDEPLGSVLPRRRQTLPLPPRERPPYFMNV